MEARAEADSALMDEDRLEAAAGALGEVDVSGAPDGAAQFTVTGSPSGAVSFHLVVDSGRASVSAGRHPRPDIVLGWAYPALESALRSDHPLEVAYMSGGVKLEGDQVLLFDGWRSLCRSPQLKEMLAALL